MTEKRRKFQISTKVQTEKGTITHEGIVYTTEEYKADRIMVLRGKIPPAHFDNFRKALSKKREEAGLPPVILMNLREDTDFEIYELEPTGE